MGALRTFLAWDLEGSTLAWERAPDETSDSVRRWVAVFRQVVAEAGGRVFKLVGDGGWADFDTPDAAVAAAIALQRHAPAGPHARCALWTGTAEPQSDGDWLGPVLNRCARLVAAGHGGQVLVAGPTALLLDRHTVHLLDLGVHRLRDVPEPVEVYQVIADGLLDAFPPLTTATHRVLLPGPRDELVGRDEILAEIADVLAECRLVTLTGVGGTGKTRLAVEAARQAAVGCSLTSFVDLSVVAQPAQVSAATLAALEVVANAEPPSVDLVCTVLRGRNALLVIDNAEHLIDATSELVDAVLDRCPDVRVLVTSREPLGVPDERVMAVPSLVPATAIELFRRRLGEPVDDSAALELCERLDGIPLAIELAAARARSLGVDEVLAHLSDRFRLLVGGRRARGRHATLHATVEWSHQLLLDDERMLFRRLSVFVGGFTVDAADAVCAPLEASIVRDALAALIDKSLVVRDGRRRYRMLETLRLFADDRLLESGEATTVRDRHVEWVRGQLDRLPYADLTTMAAMAPEVANVRAALDWLVASGRDQDVLGLVRSSIGLWMDQMLEPDIAPVVMSAYERVKWTLSPAERTAAAEMCATLSLADRPRWFAELDAIDPQRSWRTFGGRLVTAMNLSYVDGAAALEHLAAIRAEFPDPGPDGDLIARALESHARLLLGDVAGAEAALEPIAVSHPSHYRFGPMLSLADLRLLRGDVEGCRELMHRVEELHADIEQHHPSVPRVGWMSLLGCAAAIHVVSNRPERAAELLLTMEDERDRRLAFYPAAEAQWFETAALLAHGEHRYDDAAALTRAGLDRLGMETSPFWLWWLRDQLAGHPAWEATAGTTVDRACDIARAIARDAARPATEG